MLKIPIFVEPTIGTLLSTSVDVGQVRIFLQHLVVKSLLPFHPHEITAKYEQLGVRQRPGT